MINLEESDKRNLASLVQLVLQWPLRARLYSTRREGAVSGTGGRLVIMNAVDMLNLFLAFGFFGSLKSSMPD
jgi:hypothetical protein